LKLSVVMPTWHKSDVIQAAISGALSVLGGSEIDFEIIVIVDGPDKATLAAARSVSDSRLRVLELEENLGKGGAFKYGVSFTDGDYIALLDGDTDIDPNGLITAVKAFEMNTVNGLAVVYGSKLHKETTLRYPWWRILSSQLYRVYLKSLFRLDVQDTQTGLKVYRGEYLRSAIRTSKENGFVFDLEIYLLLKKSNLRFVSIPIEINYGYASTLKISSALNMIAKTTKLRFRRMRLAE
jgi:glycosyltransferase involved in cell wall biosynthesis